MPRPYLMVPDRRLRAVSAPVEGVDDDIRALWDEMLEAMYAMPGVGLAAPQIGVRKRVIVVDATQDGGRAPLRMANPEILHASSQMRTHTEGSPNLPGQWAEVSRPRAVTVSYLDETGTLVEKDLVGLWATSVQHQIDHLNGLLFIDHLKPVKKRMMVARQVKAIKRKG